MIAQRLVATVCKFSLAILANCQQVLTNDFCWKNNENVLFQEKKIGSDYLIKIRKFVFFVYDK